MKAVDYVAKYGDRIRGAGSKEIIEQYKQYHIQMLDTKEQKYDQQKEHDDRIAELTSTKDAIKAISDKLDTLKKAGEPSRIFHPIAYREYVADIESNTKLLNLQQEYAANIESYLESSQKLLEELDNKIAILMGLMVDSREQLKKLDADSTKAVSELAQDMINECIQITTNRKSSTHKGLLGAIKDLNNVWNAIRQQLTNNEGEYMLVKDGFYIMAEKHFDIPYALRKYKD